MQPDEPPPPPHSEAEPPSGDLVAALEDLALDLHWSWHHGSDEIWGRLDPDLWAATHNPWAVLQTVSPASLTAFVSDPEVGQRILSLLEDRRSHMESPAWFPTAHPDSALTGVAYFSMEFALSEALPIYSGGLGNVAGDQLKAACDLDVPVIGVGLLYQRGYFRQVMRPDGGQLALYPYNDPGQLPIRPVHDGEGDRLRVAIDFPDFRVWLRVWQVRVDRRTLYLLDTNDLANPPAVRAITSELYGGGPELRLQQEIVLGIGGWRMLDALGIAPEVCHINEGHAAFAVLERARSFAAEEGQPFDLALTATRSGNVFTTHTAVPAGFDRFDPSLVERYLGRYAEDELGISVGELLGLGRSNPADSGEPFNMAHLAVHGSGAVNGVSRLHGQVSRRLFQPLFPRWPEGGVPIGHVTNGVHVPTWDSAAADRLWTSAAGRDRWRLTTDATGSAIERVSDADLWHLRETDRAELVAYIRERLGRELTAAAMQADQIDSARSVLDPHILTLGFARRFAVYKRPTLLLRDPERLIRLLTDPERPVQLVLAGKAHPADGAGQAMLAEWVRFSHRRDLQARVVFVPDYDLLLAEKLVQGVDLWVNTPRRPWEASGTSGMKVLVNGGLNLSELDGWWAEAYPPDVGWAIGDGQEHPHDPALDANEAEAMYALLEREIVPAFYDRNDAGIPAGWIERVRRSMSTLTPRFSAARVVREYTERFYLPAAAAYRDRGRDRGALAGRVLAWRRHLAEHWPEGRFGELRVDTSADQHEFRVEVTLGELSPEGIRIELFAEPPEGSAPVIYPMRRGPAIAGSEGFEYRVAVPGDRPASDFTPRMVPYHPNATVPLEASPIAWYR